MASVSQEIQRFRVNRNAWKSNIIKEIVDLEDNLDQLFQIVGIKSHRVVTNESSEVDESTLVANNVRFKNNEPASKKRRTEGFEGIIDQHFDDIQNATSNICSLITSVTEFDLPVPVLVLVRIASRLNLLRWSDYKKKQAGTLSEKYVYANSPILIEQSLEMFKWISVVLGTNSIPFQPYINRNIMSILEWTRTSDLRTLDEIAVHRIRSQIFQYISIMLETLSTNIGLEPGQLSNLISNEMIESLDKELGSQTTLAFDSLTSTRSSEGETSDLSLLVNTHALDCLDCLERLFIVYADFLEAQQELKIKSFVIYTCLNMYRDFERNVIGLALRKKLLRFVETLANRPHASSTTELAWHIFELAERLESDAEIKFIARRSIKVGLAHRPTIVSSYGVYSAYASKLVPALTNGLTGTDEQPQEQLAAMESTTPKEQQEANSQHDDELGNGHEDDNLVGQQTTQAAHVADALQANGCVAVEGEQECKQVEENVQVQTKVAKLAEDDHRDGGDDSKRQEESEKEKEIEVEQAEDMPQDDPQVQSCLSLFVDKPAS